MQLPII